MTVKDYEKAVKAADQAIAMKQYRGFYAYMSAAYLKAKILAEQKKFAEAEQFLADFNKGRKWGKGQIWHFKYIETCGDVALAKGDIAKAKEYYNQALALEKINRLEESYQSLTDEQLCAKTEEFKQRIANGETLDSILCEAFATVHCSRLLRASS